MKKSQRLILVLATFMFFVMVVVAYVFLDQKERQRAVAQEADEPEKIQLRQVREVWYKDHLYLLRQGWTHAGHCPTSHQ